MPILHAIVLGIVQGLSEFLPISSSGHLLLVPRLFNWTEFHDYPSLEKSFDVALHLGTLIATFIALRSECASVIRGAWDGVILRERTPESRLAGHVLIATIPAAIAGIALESTIDTHLGKPVLIGIMLVVFGVVLLIADRIEGARQSSDLTWKDSAFIGFAQVLALQPGVSRSGITMSAGRVRHLDRGAAARFSFLLLIPTTGGAVLVKAKTMISEGGIPAGFGGAFLWGTVASAITGIFAIRFLLRIIRSTSFRPFVIYRVIAGIAMIVIFASGLR